MSTLPPGLPEPSLFMQIALVLEAFPRYFAEYLIGLVIAILSDVGLTSLALGCIALGLVTNSILLPITVLFLGYTGMRTVIAIANAVGHGLERFAAVYAAKQLPPQP